MKRSEMLERLRSVIENTEFIDIPNSSYYQPAELAEELLGKIEEAGMEPPFISAWGRGENKWETEDEN